MLFIYTYHTYTSILYRSLRLPLPHLCPPSDSHCFVRHVFYLFSTRVPHQRVKKIFFLKGVRSFRRSVLFLFVYVYQSVASRSPRGIRRAAVFIAPVPIAAGSRRAAPRRACASRHSSTLFVREQGARHKKKQKRDKKKYF